MFEVNNARAIGLIDQRVDFAANVVVVSLNDSINSAQQKHRLPLIVLIANVHECAQINCERDQPLLCRLQTFEQGFAGISIAIDDGERAVLERERRSVFQKHAAHRSMARALLIEDRNALAFHARLQNRNQRRAIARHGDRLIDVILKQIAYLAAGRFRFYS